jgi:hypothetical protein
MVKFPCFRLIFACFGGKVGNQKQKNKAEKSALFFLISVRAALPPEQLSAAG